MRKKLLSLAVVCLFAGFAYSAEENVFVLNEGFESGVIPEGWSQEFVNSALYGEHPWVVESAAVAQRPEGAASGNYRLSLRNNTTATIGYTTRLISPVMNLAYGQIIDPILVFSHAQPQRTGDFDQLKVYYRTSADTRWIRMDEDRFNHKITSWTRDTIKLSSQSATYQVMFEVTDNFGYGVVLDDIQVRPMPICVEPFDFMAQGLTSTSAIISWNASFDTDSFEVALADKELESISELSEEDVMWHGFITDDLFQFSTQGNGVELKRASTYYFYARAFCQGGAISEWSKFQFKTKNLSNLPLEVTFTAGQGWEYKTGTFTHIANWTFGTSIKNDDGEMEFMPFVNINTQPNTASAGYYAYDASFCLVFTGARSLSTDIPAGNYVYCATPELNVESLNNVHVGFWGTAYQSVGPDYASGIIVGVMTDPEDFTTFVPVDTCYIKENRTFNKFDVDLSSYAGNGKFVAFASDFKDKANRFYIDNIIVKESNAPTMPSDIKISNVSSNSFDLSLDSKGLNYNVVVAKRNINAAGTLVDNADNIDAADIYASLSNQSAQKLHIELPDNAQSQFILVYVQTINGEAKSEWALPAITRLPMRLSNEQLPYKIDWENTSTWQERMLYPFGSQGTTTNFPVEAITQTQYAPNAYGQNSSYASVLSGTASLEGKSSTHYLLLKKEGNSVTAGDPALYSYKHEYGNYVALPEVEDVKKVLLKFYMQRYSSTVEGSSRVAVGVMTDPYDITTFETIATFDGNSATEYEPFSCAFDSYKGEGKIIAIQAIDAENSYKSGSLSSSGYGWDYVYYSYQRIDWINIFPIGECNPIANPVVDASYNSAKISWGANDMKSWKLRVLSSKGDTILSQIVDTTSFLVEGLEPHTTYKYMVSPLCDSLYELSDWLSFTTLCLPGEALPFVEDFENEDYQTGSSKYWIPYCWSSPTYSYSYSGGSIEYYPYMSRSTLNTWAHNSKTMFALNTASSSTTQHEMWVALPQMAADIDALQVEFYVRGYSVSQNSMFQVGVMTDPSDISTFEVVDSINVVGSAWRGTIVKFDKYNGQGKYIAFKRNYERDGAVNYYIDDIIVDSINNCEKIFNVATSAPATNGATFSWKNVGADKYEVLVAKENINPNADDTTGKVVDFFETTSVSVEYSNDALNLNTNYYVYVRSICGSSSTTWSDAASFKTTCMPQTAEQYGVIDFTDVNALGCWSVGVMNGTTSAPARNGSTSSKLGFYLRMWNSTASDGAYAIMPPLAVDDISKYQIKFRGSTDSQTATNVRRVTVGIISNAADLSTFVPVATIRDLVYLPTSGDTLEALNYTIPFDSYDGDFVTGAMGNQVMFLSESGDSTNYVTLDNISFELIPSCAYPTTIAFDSIGTYGAKFSWNKTGAEYQVAVTATKVTPDQEGAEVVNLLESVKAESATVEGLEMLTRYFVYIRTICGAGDTSAWSDARIFTTQCPVAYPLPYSEDFESYPSGTKNHPSCWVSYTDNNGTITENENASYPYTTTGGNNGSTRALYMYSSGATSYYMSYAAMPQIDVDLKKVMLSFWYKANAAATASAPERRMVVGIADEVESLDTLIATFTPLDTISATETTYSKYSIILSEKYNGNGKYIVFIGFGGNGATSTGGVYIDDIEITLVPSCFVPDNLSAKMYDTEAQLSWEQLQGDNTAWDVAYGLEGADVASMSIVAANEPALTIANLLPSTAYDFYVRANCGEGEVSEWRGPLTATTLYQVALADASWTFENEPTKPTFLGQTNKAPGQWFVYNYVTGTGTAGNVPRVYPNSYNSTSGKLSSSYALSGDTVLYLNGSGAYAVLPVVANEDYDSLELHFFTRGLYTYPYRANGENEGKDSVYYTTYCYSNSTYKHTALVGVVSDPYDLSSFEPLTEYIYPTVGTSTSTKAADAVDPEGNSWWREVVVPLYGAQGKFIVIAAPEASNVLYIDDVSVQKVDPNACANVTRLAINEETLTYNSVEFSWLSPKQKFIVSISEKDSAEALLTVNLDTAYFRTEALQEQTTYVISVKALCAENVESDAVEVEFTTPCKPTDFENAYWNFTDNLYQYGTSSTYVLPQCWDEGLANGSSTSYHPYAINNPATGASVQCYSRVDTVGERALQFYTTNSYYNAYVALPELSFPLDSMNLHFWGRAARFYSGRCTNMSNINKLSATNQNYSRTLIVGLIADADDFETFIPVDTITYRNVWSSQTTFAYEDETGNNFWQEYVLPLAKYAALIEQNNALRLAIVAPRPGDFSTASSPTSYFYVDDLEIIKGDFCTPISGEKAENITANSAVIRWIELADKNTVEILVANDDSFSEGSIVFNDTVFEGNSVEINNLKSGTKYFFRLKHICDLEAGDESNWTATSNFTTDYVVRFHQNFNAVGGTIPADWGRSLSASAEDVFSGEKTLAEATATATYTWRTSANSNGDVYAYTNTTTNNAGSSSSYQYQWFFTPELDLTANAEDKLMLSFDIALRGSTSTSTSIALPNPNTDVVEKFLVVVSEDGGKTWTADNAIGWSTEGDEEFDYAELYTRGQLATKFIDMTKYAGKTIKIAFYSGSFANKNVAGSKNIVVLDNVQLNTYTAQNYEGVVCRWEDYSAGNFNIDADDLNVGINQFVDFKAATKDGEDDILDQLTVIVEEDAVTEIPEVILCEGEQFTQFNFNFEASQSGVYKQKLQSANGCDSTVVLNVTVNPRLYNDAVATICQGAYYEFNGVRYYTSTEKVDTISSLVTGCDSIVTLHLTVNDILREDEGVVYICPDMAYNFTEKFDSIVEGGVYVDTVQNEQGCDVVKTIEVIQAFDAHVDIRAAICKGEVYEDATFSGLSRAGVYTTPSGILKTEHGCDSTVTLTLLVADNGTLYDSIAVEDLPYVLNGEELFGAETERGIYTTTINLGCGEVTLVLNIGMADGLNSVYANTVAVSPNPAKVGEPIKVLSSFSESQLSQMTVNVYSAAGMLVSTQQPRTNDIVISPLATSGVYMVVVRSGSQMWQSKLVVE